MQHTSAAPNAKLAAAIARNLFGDPPVSVQRFAMGARHYVFEVTPPGRPPVVVRIGDARAHAEIAGAIRLSNLPRPRGVPLPAILASDVQSGFPWMVLERLPGTDIGAVIDGLPDERLDQIAARMASAQSITAKTASAGRYGYAARPRDAPHEAWSQVLEENLRRSRRRMTAAGLFDPGLVDPVRAVLARIRDRLDAIAPTPFLHDTTTKNVIVTPDGDFSGIVDVDDLCFGDVRYPAALTLAALLFRGGPVRYVAAWLRFANQPDDQVFRFYVALFVLDLMAEQGQVFNGTERLGPPETRAALLRAYQDSLRVITR